MKTKCKLLVEEIKIYLTLPKKRIKSIEKNPTLLIGDLGRMEGTGKTFIWLTIF